MAKKKTDPRILPILVLVASVAVLQACCTPCETYRPKWIDHPAQICIERPEESGYLNISEANIIIENFQVIPLAGGQAACVYVSPGDYFVRVRSRDPYNPDNPNPEAWKSETLRFDLKEGEKVEVLVCKSNWESRSQWLLKYANQRGGDKCLVELQLEQEGKGRGFDPGQTKKDREIIELKIDLPKERELQKAVDEGHQPWRLDPISVAAAVVAANVTRSMTVENCRIKSENDIDAEVECKNNKNYVVTLKKLVRLTRNGIWTAVSIEVQK